MFICFSHSSLYAEDITIITQDLPYRTEKWGEGEIGGIGGEIITKALRDSKVTFKVVWMPWKRAQEECIQNNDGKSFIIPLTRNAEREPNYSWVSKIYNADTVFVTYKDSTIINSLPEAKGKKIGVLLATSYQQFLENPKNGLNPQDIRAAPYDYMNAKDLEDKKIDAWYTLVIGTFSFLKDQKKDLSKYDFGNKIHTEENYIATSKTTNPEIIKKVKNAVENFKKTQQYFSIIKKYTGKNS